MEIRKENGEMESGRYPPSSSPLLHQTQPSLLLLIRIYCFRHPRGEEGGEGAGPAGEGAGPIITEADSCKSMAN